MHKRSMNRGHLGTRPPAGAGGILVVLVSLLTVLGLAVPVQAHHRPDHAGGRRRRRRHPRPRRHR